MIVDYRLWQRLAGVFVLAVLLMIVVVLLVPAYAVLYVHKAFNVVFDWIDRAVDEIVRRTTG